LQGKIFGIEKGEGSNRKRKRGKIVWDLNGRERGRDGKKVFLGSSIVPLIGAGLGKRTLFTVPKGGK